MVFYLLIDKSEREENLVVALSHQRVHLSRRIKMEIKIDIGNRRNESKEEYQIGFTDTLGEWYTQERSHQMKHNGVCVCATWTRLGQTPIRVSEQVNISKW